MTSVTLPIEDFSATPAIANAELASLTALLAIAPNSSVSGAVVRRLISRMQQAERRVRELDEAARFTNFSNF